MVKRRQKLGSNVQHTPIGTQVRNATYVPGKGYGGAGGYFSYSKSIGEVKMSRRGKKYVSLY